MVVGAADGAHFAAGAIACASVGCFRRARPGARAVRPAGGMVGRGPHHRRRCARQPGAGSPGLSADLGLVRVGRLVAGTAWKAFCCAAAGLGFVEPPGLLGTDRGFGTPDLPGRAHNAAGAAAPGTPDRGLGAGRCRLFAGDQPRHLAVRVGDHLARASPGPYFAFPYLAATRRRRFGGSSRARIARPSSR